MHDRNVVWQHIGTYTGKAILSIVGLHYANRRFCVRGVGEVAARHEVNDLLFVWFADALPRSISMQDVSVENSCLVETGEVKTGDLNGNARWHDGFLRGL